eukprot:CAMPEP_0116124408 /NCGR_PEP_ID=MMETSP0329-20121206/5265_1 /TAXON_ID=697910 /ORGANISM="Pseudo-nitzschia arenysensis, Strain B593" /LENGTH=409 /DNA_ID=CAMNT_0003618387 /DNA_START=57 /DNA_END=1286 /DNA_ORIENTATION=+
MKDTEIAHSEGSDVVTSDGDSALPKSSFITTSDVLNQLNKQLTGLSEGDGDGSSQDGQKQFFELQKRLPDGSTIPATKDEIAAADFKSKLDQSAKFVSELESPEDRQLWAEEQRLAGNAFFQQGDYKGAMDIYLTCLVVKEDTPEFIRRTFLPILNNLAQCTLQLGMYKKTIVFCETALEEVSKVKQKVPKETIEENAEATQRNLQDSIALCKILFKLGKALRLTGYYKRAREALNNSIDCLIGEENDGLSSDSINSNSPLEPYKKAIKKEFRYLDVAEKEAKRNLARQKRAMQKVLSSPATSKTSGTQDKEDGINEKSSLSDSLYEQSPRKREFSTLRARKHRTFASFVNPEVGMTKTHSDDQEGSTSYSQYYWSMVARVAKRLLVMLGDEGDVDDDREMRTIGKKKS